MSKNNIIPCLLQPLKEPTLDCFLNSKEIIIFNHLISKYHNSIDFNGYLSNIYNLKKFTYLIRLSLYKLHYCQHMGHLVIKLKMQKVISIKRKDKN